MTQVLSDEDRLHLRNSIAAQVFFGTYASITNRGFLVDQVTDAILAALDAFEDRLAGYVNPEDEGTHEDV